MPIPQDAGFAPESGPDPFFDPVSLGLDTAIDFLKAPFVPVINTVEAAVEQLKSVGREFVELYNYMTDSQAFIAEHPDLAPAYASLMNRGAPLYGQLKSLAITLSGSLGQFLGIAVRSVGLSGLGAGPLLLIPAAVMVGAVAAMTIWIADAVQFQSKIELIKDLEAKGHDPVAVASALGGASSTWWRPLLLYGVAGFAIVKLVDWYVRKD